MYKKGKTIFFIIILYISIFQDFLQKYIVYFKYFDEILALLFFPFLYFYCFKNKKNLKIKKDNAIIFTSLIFIILIGLFSNFYYKYQNLTIVLSDLLLFIKFFLLYFLSSILWEDDFFENKSKLILFHVKVIIIILAIFTICNYMFNLYIGDYRFGIKSNTLFFSHSTVLATVCIFLLSLLIRCSKKTVSPFYIICILLLFSTLRLKAIGACIMILFLAYYVEKNNKKISISKLLVLAVIILVVSFDQISYYYIDSDGSARRELTKTAFLVAKDYFPLGTGFGTYASHFSAVSYSVIYYKYNLNYIYGITPENPYFVSDVFWPMVIGQFGYIGLILYLICLYKIFKKIQDEFSADNVYIYISKMICLAYLIIASTSEAAFAGPIAMSLAIVIGSNSRRGNNEEVIEN